METEEEGFFIKPQQLASTKSTKTYFKKGGKSIQLKQMWRLRVLQIVQVSVTEACGTTSFQKNRPKIRSNLTCQIEHVLAKVSVKNQFRRRSKPPAETTEREDRERRSPCAKKTPKRLFFRL